MKSLIILALIVPAIALSAEQKPLTLDEFNRQIDAADRDERYRSSIIKQNGLHTLLPDDDSPQTDIVDGAEGGEGAARSTRSDTNEPGNTSGADSTSQESGTAISTKNTETEKTITPGTDAKTTKRETQQKQSNVGGGELPGTSVKTTQELGKKVVKPIKATNKPPVDYYFPKTLSKQTSSDIEAISITFTDKKILFGISIGSTIPIKLRRVSTNVQPGYIELVTLADIAGKKKILPANSIIFARPNVVKGSSRLYLNTIRGVTPQGLEFNINGHISDDHNTAGLSGVIKSDGRALSRSATSGAVALGTSLIGNLSDDAVSSAASAASNQLIREGVAESKANLDRPAFIISSSPQNGTLTVEDTF